MSEIVGPLGQFELFRPTQPHDHNRTRDRVERRISADFRPGPLRPRPKTSRRSCRNHNPRKSASCACNRLAVQGDRPRQIQPSPPRNAQKDRFFGGVNGEAGMAMLKADAG